MPDRDGEKEDASCRRRRFWGVDAKEWSTTNVDGSCGCGAETIDQYYKRRQAYDDLPAPKRAFSGAGQGRGNKNGVMGLRSQQYSAFEGIP